MIKKTFFIVIILVLSLYSNALANDGGSRPDSERISFVCTVKSTEVKIGEPFEFTIKITNHTSREAELISLPQIFKASFDTDNADIKDIVIDPYKTISLDVSYVVPASINWYQKNGEYYVDFYPELYYEAKELLDGEEQYEWYNEEDDYWDYYQESKKAVPYKITNLSDGSEYAAISILDYKSIIGFNDSAYKVSASWNGELVGYMSSYLRIQNNCDKTLTNVYVYENTYYADKFENVTLEKDKSYQYNHETSFYIMENEIPETMDIDYRMIFSMDNKYYCIYVTRQYKTGIYLIPDIQVRETRTYNDNSREYTCTYSVENNTNKDYENFVIYYGEWAYNRPENIEEWEDSLIYGTFKSGDKWNIPVTYFQNEDPPIIAGFLIDNVLYYDKFSKSYSNILQEDTTVLYDYNGSYNEQDKWDMYDFFNEINITYPTPTPATESTPSITPTEYITPTSTPTSSEPTLTSTDEYDKESVSTLTNKPASTPEDSKIAVAEKELSYIPIWSWIVLFIAVITIIAVIVYKNRK